MFKGLERIHYLLGLLTLLFIFLIVFQVSPYIDRSVLYLVLLNIVILNVWFGGKKLGLFTTFISLFHLSIFLLILIRINSTNLFSLLTEFVLFAISSFLTVIFIEKYKKTDIIRFHVKRENELIFKNRMYERKVKSLEKEVKTRDEFLSIASHELKTPLTSMLLKIQLILHNIRNVSLANFSVSNLMQQLETAESQTKRLSELINDLLNVSLITTGRMKLTKKEENVAHIVKDVLQEFKEPLNKENINVITRYSDDTNAFIDRVRIEQLLSNLITNAIKYGNKKPIEILVQKNKAKIFISVTDQGIGIPNEFKDKMFSLFERGLNGKEKRGLGVGLYIANQIAQAHNGKIKVKSTEGEGSEFTVELPIK